MFYGLVGASPPTPVHFAEDIKGDFFAILTGGLGLITVIMTAYLFLRPAEPQGRLEPPTRSGSGACSTSTATRTHSATSRCATTRA